jgi:hypothetical protein
MKMHLSQHFSILTTRKKNRPLVLRSNHKTSLLSINIHRQHHHHDLHHRHRNTSCRQDHHSPKQQQHPNLNTTIAALPVCHHHDRPTLADLNRQPLGPHHCHHHHPREDSTTLTTTTGVVRLVAWIVVLVIVDAPPCHPCSTNDPLSILKWPRACTRHYDVRMKPSRRSNEAFMPSSRALPATLRLEQCRIVNWSFAPTVASCLP